MSNKKTPEQRAEAKYPDCNYRDTGTPSRRSGYATCIREEVEPLEAEVERLRALAQVLVNGLHSEVDMVCDCEFCAKGVNAMKAAKSQGFVPTNTTEG